MAPTNAMVELSAAQKDTLAGFERTIRKGQKSFLETARAVYEIGVQKLFVPHASLTAYCRAVWEFDKVATSRYRAAGEVLADLDGCETLPATESQCRLLAKLAKADRRVKWEQIVASAKTADKKVTAEMIAKAIGATQEPATQPGADKETDSDIQTTAPAVLRVVGENQCPTCSAVIVATLEPIEATVMQDAGFEMEPVGKDQFQFSITGTRKAILANLSDWNLLDKVQSLAIQFNDQ